MNQELHAQVLAVIKDTLQEDYPHLHQSYEDVARVVAFRVAGYVSQYVWNLKRSNGNVRLERRSTEA